MSVQCQPEVRGIVPERELPACVREALAAARRSRPHSTVTCLAFHSLAGGRELVHIEPDAESTDPFSVSSILRGLHAKDLLVLTVSVTETTFETVDTVTHVLVALTSRRESGG